MRKYRYTTIDGIVRFETTMRSASEPPAMPGLTCNEVPIDDTPPPAPNDFTELHHGSRSWIDTRSLAQQKQAGWERIKAARQAALTAPLVTPFGVFDANEAGQTNIARAVLLANNLAALGGAPMIDFTLYDNSVVTLSGASMVQVGLIMAGREQLLRAHATTLRTLIESLGDEVEIDAVIW